jgi:hypothetical protein
VFPDRTKPLRRPYRSAPPGSPALRDKPVQDPDFDANPDFNSKAKSGLDFGAKPNLVATAKPGPELTPNPDFVAKLEPKMKEKTSPKIRVQQKNGRQSMMAMLEEYRQSKSTISETEQLKPDVDSNKSKKPEVDSNKSETPEPELTWESFNAMYEASEKRGKAEAERLEEEKRFGQRTGARPKNFFRKR